ncbi:MAG: hypothetical protein L0Z73_07440 [Gammaproteobacteria bacterium]|nr:hypothetical protein [Gammaproteobacteria bacterium]
MFVLDAETIAKHYVKGSLSKEQFVSLSASLALVERYAQSGNIVKKFISLFLCTKELRNYSIKCRIKSVWRIINYAWLALLALSAAVVWRVDMEDLRDMWQSEIDVVQLADLVIAGTPEPLPEDMRMAVEYLSENSEWERLHVKQIRTRWAQLDAREKDVIRQTHWYREFLLLVTIKKVEEQKRQTTKSGKRTVRYLAELHELSDLLS